MLMSSAYSPRVKDGIGELLFLMYGSDDESIPIITATESQPFSVSINIVTPTIDNDQGTGWTTLLDPQAVMSLFTSHSQDM